MLSNKIDNIKEIALIVGDQVNKGGKTLDQLDSEYEKTNKALDVTLKKFELMINNNE